jgi:hypothetical protein
MASPRAIALGAPSTHLAFDKHKGRGRRRRVFPKRTFRTEREYFRGPAMALSIPAMTGLKQAMSLVWAGDATAGFAAAFWPHLRRKSA